MTRQELLQRVRILAACDTVYDSSGNQIPQAEFLEKLQDLVVGHKTPKEIARIVGKGE